MNREVIFRGKRVDNGEWIYGYYVVDPLGKHRIYLKPFEEATSNSYYFVIPESVGQFTGLKDKNVKDIYEGDILKHPNAEKLFVVVFVRGEFRLQSQDAYFLKHNITSNISHIEFCDLMGNIHSNPDLL